MVSIIAADGFFGTHTLCHDLISPHRKSVAQLAQIFSSPQDSETISSDETHSVANHQLGPCMEIPSACANLMSTHHDLYIRVPVAIDPH